MNGEGINYKLPEGAILKTVQCRAITKRRGLDRRCLHRTQRGIYCHQHLKVKRGLRITESEAGEFGDQGQLGVFTTKPIKKGQIICDFTGKKVVADEEYENPFGLWVKQQPPTFIDGRVTTENGEGRFVQDGGDENNAEIVYNSRGIGQLKALRNIAAGEEILADRNSEEKVDFIVPANMGAVEQPDKPKKKKLLVRQSVSDAYADEPEPAPRPEPVWVPPPAPKTAVPRPAAAPRPVAPQLRPKAAAKPAAVIPDRPLTVKEKRYRLWLLAMQKLYHMPYNYICREGKKGEDKTELQSPGSIIRRQAIHPVQRADHDAGGLGGTEAIQQVAENSRVGSRGSGQGLHQAKATADRKRHACPKGSPDLPGRARRPARLIITGVAPSAHDANDVRF